MPGSSSITRELWADRGAQYAKEYGWQILPLQANNPSSPMSWEEPIERKLGAELLVTIDEASDDPAVIKEMQTAFPVALIGAKTGRDSNLIAVEISLEEKSSLRELIHERAPDAPRVLGPNREYVLFQYPRMKADLPTHTEVEGAVLHGEQSVIRLPWHYYSWGIRNENSLSRPDSEILELFGVTSTEGGRGQASSREETPSPSRDGHPNVRTNGESNESSVHWKKSASRTDSASGKADQLFRTARQLRPREDEAVLGIPWTIPGGLSVLTGELHVVGLPLWGLNLAAHVAAGHHFLDADPVEGEVVVLADSTPAHFRRLLQRFDILEHEDFARLHVIHRCDVRELSWRAVLGKVYERAQRVDAKLILISDLGRYLQLKAGPHPTTSEKVARALTVESPPDCAILAVKGGAATCPNEPLARTISRLRILGGVADKILRLDDVSSKQYPRLRRLSVFGKADAIPSVRYCVHDEGRFETVKCGASRDELPSLQAAGSSAKRSELPEPDLFDA